jgi:hypothetical protein
MSRPDLLALTPEALVRLANAGLVKRAQKEVDGGAVSDVHELADGTVVATSRDGATTRLPPKVTLQAAPCTCGASTVCRHRLAAVLAYQRHVRRRPSVPAAPWDPGEFTDAEVAATCGAGVAIADRLAAAGADRHRRAGTPRCRRWRGCRWRRCSSWCRQPGVRQVRLQQGQPAASTSCWRCAASGSAPTAASRCSARRERRRERPARGASARAAVEQWAAQICQFGVTAPGSAERTAGGCARWRCASAGRGSPMPARTTSARSIG